jgi:hypothetical protein
MIRTSSHAGNNERGAFMRKLNSRLLRVVGFVVLAMATGVLLWAIPAVAGLTVGTESQVSGTVSKWVARNSDDGECAEPFEWLDIDDTEVTFHTTGFHKRALIFFQAKWFPDNGFNVVDLRAVVDDEVVEVGDDDFVNFDVNERETHGFNWISEELHPGSHTAVIQWFSPGGVPCLNQRSTIVQTS